VNESNGNPKLAGVEKWAVVLGGSWGCTLAIAYAQARLPPFFFFFFFFFFIFPLKPGNG